MISHRTPPREDADPVHPMALPGWTRPCVYTVRKRVLLVLIALIIR